MKLPALKKEEGFDQNQKGQKTLVFAELVTGYRNQIDHLLVVDEIIPLFLCFLTLFVPHQSSQRNQKVMLLFTFQK